MRKEDYLRPLSYFAETVHKLALSDRDINIGVGGFTGEGKSCLLTKFFKEYAKFSGVPWNFDLMTWSRKELMKWIDGEGPDQKGQLPEFSGVLVDELFMLFYKRNWYDEDQIDSIGTLNMCRDRHLVVGGNIPSFWDLDSGFTSRIRFYIYVPSRGIAWVFEQENNPFAMDKWNRAMNEKKFRQYKSPYMLPNFLCEIHYDDWTPKEKEAYYLVRNKKRLMAVSNNKTEKAERYSDIKKQRDALIIMLMNTNKKLKNKDVSDVLGISSEAVRLIRNGSR